MTVRDTYSIDWMDKIKGKQLYLPDNHPQGFEFVGSKPYKGLRLIVGSSWELRYYDDVILDSSRASSNFDSQIVLNFESGWSFITGVSMDFPVEMSFFTKGQCGLHINKGLNTDFKISIQLDGKTLFEHWKN